MNYIIGEHSKQHTERLLRLCCEISLKLMTATKGMLIEFIAATNYVKPITKAAWNEMNLICISKDFIS